MHNTVFISYSFVVAVSSPLLASVAVHCSFLPLPLKKPSTTTTTTPTTTLILEARKAGKTSKRKSNSSGVRGGFGSGSATTATSVSKKNGKKKNGVQQQEGDDYSVFPRLEPNVMETLVEDEESQLGELPGEIYNRLEQIYGLPHFNYEQRTTTTETEEEEESSTTMTSLTDMLGVSSASEEESSSSPLDNLLLSTTDSDTDTPEQQQKQQLTDSSSSDSDDPLSLNELPPFRKFRVLHVDPLVLSIDNFFSDQECDAYVEACSSGVGGGKKKNKKNSVMQSRSPTVGKDAAAKAQRTSTTWYHHYKDVPELMAKACRLLGLSTIEHWEEPQTVRYRRNEKFTWHLDALGPAENQPKLGGQRTATLLVYHTTLGENDGGATVFRDLGGSQPLKMRPKKGSALLFFPAAGGIPDTPFDIRTLHCGEVVSNDAEQDKWISQLWLRHAPYKPTAPPGNNHNAATDAISNYCKQQQS